MPACYKCRPSTGRRSSAHSAMRLYAFILAVCVCAHHTRAASIALPDNKFDLDNVDLEDEPKEDNLRNTNEVIPVKVIEEPVLDENSNDYVPPYDTNINIKRVEVDLANPGLPQRQQHETQNPENFSDNDKIIVAIRHTIEQAENVFNEGLKGVSNSFKTFLQANEDLPAIQENIKNLKETFTGQIEKLNETIRTYLKPETATSGESVANPKLEIVQARLTFLDDNFRLGLDTLTEGVEVYSIIKEEDKAEAEKAIELKADVKAEPEVVPVDPTKPVDKPAPANPAPGNVPPATGPQSPLTIFITNWQNTMSNAFTSFSNMFTGNNANGQIPGQAQPSNPIANLFQGISLPNIFQGQNTGGQAQVPAKPVTDTQAQHSNPSNTQADTVPAPAPPPLWTPQGLYNSVTSTWTSTWNNLVNPGQNNQPQEQQNVPPQSANPNPFQQAIQNIVSFITPQPPQAQQPVNPVNPQPPAVAATPEKTPQKAPESAPTKPEATVAVQGSNVVPAPVNEQPQEPAQPSEVNPVSTPAGPIQQLVQNNPIIKGIQNAVQRIQGPPNPETPREEVVQETVNKGEIEDPKGHHHGGHWSENNVTNQVTAWGTFVNGLVTSIGALLNGTTTSVSTAVNSAINTIGANLQAVLATAAG
ncbi:proteoglycan 4-like isoform X2 [Maniola jurtina]|uniref:proteoglycan 4-like isoform X2 n=1 Tax=Maniola jurtina TaxID=191418 RepID=UPI001E6886A5|nr:proteoglycan 4-like isoform X2 [Maniola jurtina]